VANNRDTVLLETVKTHRARLLSAFLYGELAERRLGQDNIKRLLGSIVLAAVVCTGCVGFSLVTSLLASQAAAKQASQQSSTNPVPGIDDQAYAADYFDRPHSRGWGTAEVGGQWRTSGPGTDYAVRGGVGLIEVPIGASRVGYLTGADRETADATTTVAMDELGSTVIVIGRKVASDDYRAVVELQNNRQVSVALASRQAGKTVGLSNSAGLLGAYGAGTRVKIRLQVFGVNPTVVRAKVWRASDTEPRDWTVGAQDGFDALQRSGAPGVGATRPRGPRALEVSVYDFVARPVIG
jgi:hypothetical protein